MAKQKENKQLTRRQLDRHHREAKAEKTLAIVAISVVAVIIVLAVIGIVTEVVQTRRPVARIDEQLINAGEFSDRQYYERWSLRLQVLNFEENIQALQAQSAAAATSPQPEDEQTDTSAMDSYIQQLQAYSIQLSNQLSYDQTNLFAGQVLDTIIEEHLVMIESEARGLTVTEDEIDLTIEAYLGYDREAALAASEATTDTLDTVMTAEDYAATLDIFETQVLKVANYDMEDFRESAKAELLREKLIEDLSGELDTTTDQVQSIAFMVDSEEIGLELRDRLNSGEEDVSLVMEELNADIENGIMGYELPFLPVNYLDSQFSLEIAQITFNTNIGKATEPLLGPGDSYFVMYVVAHEEHELSEDLFGSSADQAYQEWLDEQIATRTEYLEWEKAVLTEP